MRIISGSHKGRAFHPPKNLPVRPTTDFGKEALFNILNNRLAFETTSALDLFCGTGSIGYELASRGCPSVIAVDSNFGCCTYAKKMAEEFGFKNIQVIKSDVFKFINTTHQQFDFIFADPPYSMQETIELPDLIFNKNLLCANGILIVEHPRELSFTSTERFLEQRNYSKVNFSIFT